jgi:hypothetical protein
MVELYHRLTIARRSLMSDARTSLPSMPATTLLVTFDAGQLSSDGGLVWLARADDRFGVSAAFAEQMRDGRRGPVRHPRSVYLLRA